MKKILLVLFCLASFTTYSQGFDKGVKNLNLGLGLGYGIGLNGTFDIGITDAISVGVVGSYSRSSYGIVGYRWRANYIVGGARIGVHLGKYLAEPLNLDESKIDPYIGLSGGFRGASYGSNYAGNGGLNAGIFVGGYAGLRYALKENIGVFAEAGTPFSSIGVTFKF
jgi:hypothetical protein